MTTTDERATMRQIVVERLGEPDVMELREVVVPQPGAGEVRLKVEAVGINFADVLAVKGEYLTRTRLPLTPGAEFAGTVDALGEGVQGFTAGQQVTSLAGAGGLSEYAVVPARSLVPVPDGLSAAEAAAFPVSYYTAYVTLVTLGRAGAGETVLVQGAAGALGTALIQVAKALSLRVVALASSEEKLEVARRLGADVTLLSERGDLVDAVKAVTDGRGADIVVEITGGPMLEKSLALTASRGCIMIVGNASREPSTLNPTALMKKNVSVTGVWLTSMLGEPGVVQEAVAFFNPLVADGTLRPQVGPRYALADAAQGFRDLAGRKTTGKVVIEPQR